MYNHVSIHQSLIISSFQYSIIPYFSLHLFTMSEVFTIRMLSGEDDNFVRDFEVKTIQTLLDLHHAIQKNLHFDPGLMSSFFTTDGTWVKREEFPLVNMTDEHDFPTMENTRVGDVAGEKGDRLLYVYDYLSNRGFFIEVINITRAEEGKNYPLCCREESDAPPQLLIEDLTGTPGEDIFPDDMDDDLLSDGFEDIDDIPEI